MTFSQPSPAPPNKSQPEQCKHPRVQIVSRDEDSEYVECQECGDVFETSELKDMAIEEKKEPKKNEGVAVESQVSLPGQTPVGRSLSFDLNHQILRPIHPILLPRRNHRRRAVFRDHRGPVIRRPRTSCSRSNTGVFTALS